MRVRDYEIAVNVVDLQRLRDQKEMWQSRHASVCRALIVAATLAAIGWCIVAVQWWRM